MKFLGRIFDTLFKIYFVSSVGMGIVFTVGLYFAARVIFMTYTNDIFSSTAEALTKQFFSSPLAIANYIFGILLTFISISLAAWLFKCCSQFVKAKKSSKSLLEQSQILLKIPKILVALYILHIGGFFISNKILAGADIDQYSKKIDYSILPGGTFFKIYDELIHPNLGSSLNLILAVLVFIYAKSLIETHNLKKEAELVV